MRPSPMTPNQLPTLSRQISLSAWAAAWRVSICRCVTIIPYVSLYPENPVKMPQLVGPVYPLTSHNPKNLQPDSSIRRRRNEKTGVSRKPHVSFLRDGGPQRTKRRAHEFPQIGR